MYAVDATTELSTRAASELGAQGRRATAGLGVGGGRGRRAGDVHFTSDRNHCPCVDG